jgi:hypothetical protein
MSSTKAANLPDVRVYAIKRPFGAQPTIRYSVKTRGLTTSVARPPFSEIVRSRLVWRPAPPTRSRRLSGDHANVKGTQTAVQRPPGWEKTSRRWRPFPRSTMIPARVVHATIDRSGDHAADVAVT